MNIKGVAECKGCMAITWTRRNTAVGARQHRRPPLFYKRKCMKCIDPTVSVIPSEHIHDAI
jgi:hypothetical protein